MPGKGIGCAADRSKSKPQVEAHHESPPIRGIRALRGLPTTGSGMMLGRANPPRTDAPARRFAEAVVRGSIEASPRPSRHRGYQALVGLDPSLDTIPRHP